MAFINPVLCECAKSKLALFSVKPTHTNIEDSAIVEYQPISSIQNNTPLK